MTVHLPIPALTRLDPPARRTRSQARGERKRLAEQDRASRRLAELYHVRDLLVQARSTVTAGWVQNAWFAYHDDEGAHPVTVHNLTALEGRTVTGACLVGAVVHAGGGPAAARGQLVQRTLDLTWQTLYGDPADPVRWFPSQAVRMAHLRDLTGWNDRPGRSRHQVLALLSAAEQAATAEIERSALSVRA